MRPAVTSVRSPGRGSGKRVEPVPADAGMVTGTVVGVSDYRLIVASMVSRRGTQAISGLARGVGVHRVGRGARNFAIFTGA